MATVNNVKLAITLDGSDFSPVTVTYTVGFSTTDVKNNDAYTADVTLWGEDGGLKGADDYLISFTQVNVTPDGQTSKDLQAFQVVPNKTLDEDNLDADELYAQVVLTEVNGAALSPVKSNIVKHRF